MPLYTKTAADVFDPVDGTGRARGADMADAQLWGTEVENAASAASAQASLLIIALAATSLTLNAANASTYQGAMIVTSSGAAVTITLANDLPVGFNCGVKQNAAGAVSFVAGAGATIHAADNNLTLSGIYAVVGLFVDANAGGAAVITLA